MKIKELFPWIMSRIQDVMLIQGLYYEKPPFIKGNSFFW